MSSEGPDSAVAVCTDALEAERLQPLPELPRIVNAGVGKRAYQLGADHLVLPEVLRREGDAGADDEGNHRAQGLALLLSEALRLAFVIRNLLGQGQTGSFFL